MNKALLDQLKSSPALPSLPAIAIQALALARKDNVSIEEIAAVISNDPALSSKILKTVNSSFYGLPKQVSTISHALVILGMQAVKTLALGFSLLSNLNSGNGDSFDYMLYWKRSLYSGVAGRLLARRMNIVQQEEIFLACLLADIGMVVMHRGLGAPFDELLKASEGDQDRLDELCRKKFDLDHSQVGAMLAETWQLPPVLANPISQHHNATEQDPQLRLIVDVVYVAMQCGEIFAGSNPAAAIVKARTEVTKRFKITLEEFEIVMAEIGKSTSEVATLFDVNIGPSRSYQEILDEANQTLIQMTLQTQIQVQEIKKENANLQHAATTDGLTGVANRARFNEFIDEQFARAFKQQRPLALLFLDIDHFKKVNDTYGHQAGDEVLRRIGKLLKLAVRNMDLAARYGGEEFSLVLTETDSNSAAQMADELRQAIQAERFTFEGQVIPVTASIGVAGTNRQRIFATSQQLASAADRAVYAAKQAGRNCVRLFRPRVNESAAAGKAPLSPVAVQA